MRAHEDIEETSGSDLGKGALEVRVIHRLKRRGIEGRARGTGGWCHIEGWGQRIQSWVAIGTPLGHGFQKAGCSGALAGLEFTPGLLSAGRPGARTGVIQGAIWGAGVTTLLALCLYLIIFFT